MTDSPRSGEFCHVRDEVIHDSWLTVARSTFSDPHDDEFERLLVRHPGAVGIVPVLDDGETVLLVRQYRGALDRYVVEIPAGKRDVEGESPEETARRELAEEVGMKAGRLDLLARFCNSPGFTDEETVVYLARDLTETAVVADGIEEDHMTIERVSLRDLPQLIAGGVITDAKTLIGLLLAREWIVAGN